MNQQEQQNANATNASQTPQGATSYNAIQRDLENQLRAFGSSVSDGISYGFDGKGEEISAQAKNIGLSVAAVLQSEFQKGVESVGGTQSTQANQYGGVQNNRAANYHYDPETAQGSSTPASASRYSTGHASGASAKKKANRLMLAKASSRFGVGIAQAIFGGLFAFALLLSGVISLVVGTTIASIATQVVGAALTITGIPLLIMAISGSKNIAIAQRVRRYASVVGTNEKVLYADLAKSINEPISVVRKDFAKLAKKGWLDVWTDETTQTVYMSLEAYRADCLTLQGQAEQAAQKAAKEAAQAEQAKKVNAISLDSVKNFVDVLGKQKELMTEQAAVQELEHMQEVSTDIYDWVLAHPETAPRVRRFGSYYMPTTLKLLHSYNELKGQQGENAQKIRAEIATTLHTLNTAFDNLHNTLLSDVNLDISSEIAALQGMLAQDGLSNKEEFTQKSDLDLTL